MLTPNVPEPLGALTGEIVQSRGRVLVYLSLSNRTSTNRSPRGRPSFDQGIRAPAPGYHRREASTEGMEAQMKPWRWAAMVVATSALSACGTSGTSGTGGAGGTGSGTQSTSTSASST